MNDIKELENILIEAFKELSATDVRFRKATERELPLFISEWDVNCWLFHFCLQKLIKKYPEDGADCIHANLRIYKKRENKRTKSCFVDLALGFLEPVKKYERYKSVLIVETKVRYKRTPSVLLKDTDKIQFLLKKKLAKKGYLIYVSRERQVDFEEWKSWEESFSGQYKDLSIKFAPQNEYWCLGFVKTKRGL